jgi:hypothetical protein
MNLKKNKTRIFALFTIEHIVLCELVDNLRNTRVCSPHERG